MIEGERERPQPKRRTTAQLARRSEMAGDGDGRTKMLNERESERRSNSRGKVYFKRSIFYTNFYLVMNFSFHFDLNYFIVQYYDFRKWFIMLIIDN